jgi:hypothetical protein
MRRSHLARCKVALGRDVALALHWAAKRPQAPFLSLDFVLAQLQEEAIVG